MDLRATHSFRDDGLTLVELLVVLAIIGVVTGATLLWLTPGHPSLKAEAQRLAGTIQNAADTARIREEPAALVSNANGYDLTGGRAARHVLPLGTTLAVNQPSAASLALDGSRTFTLTLTRGSERWAVTFDGIHADAFRLDPGR